MQTVAVFLAVVAVAAAGGLNGYASSNYVQHAHVAQPIAYAQPAVAVRASPIAYAQPAVVRTAPLGVAYGAGPALAYGGPVGVGHVGGVYAGGPALAGAYGYGGLGGLHY